MLDAITFLIKFGWHRKSLPEDQIEGLNKEIKQILKELIQGKILINREEAAVALLKRLYGELSPQILYHIATGNWNTYSNASSFMGNLTGCLYVLEDTLVHQRNLVIWHVRRLIDANFKMSHEMRAFVGTLGGKNRIDRKAPYFKNSIAKIKAKYEEEIEKIDGKEVNTLKEYAGLCTRIFRLCSVAIQQARELDGAVPWNVREKIEIGREFQLDPLTREKFEVLKRTILQIMGLIEQKRKMERQSERYSKKIVSLISKERRYVF